ncbi:hypothetical protein [Marinifilum breve]|nr:hypothetical protein [Marinifilum breve]
MLLSYKTERLPLNFFMLGISLFLIGIALTISEAYQGIVAIILSIPFLFTHSGLLIDAENKRYKKYTGLLGLRLGSWCDLSRVTHLQIIHTRETKGMAVLSIARNETNVVQKLLLMMPHERIVLLSDTQEKLEPMAKKIAKELGLELKFPKN